MTACFDAVAAADKGTTPTDFSPALHQFEKKFPPTDDDTSAFAKTSGTAPQMRALSSAKT
jgi:hypothetical protein